MRLLGRFGSVAGTTYSQVVATMVEDAILEGGKAQEYAGYKKGGVLGPSGGDQEGVYRGR